MRLQLSLEAEDLPGTSVIGGIPDAFAVVTLVNKSKSSKPTLLGQTEVVHQSKDPDWTKIFYIDNFQLGEYLNIIVSIYSENNKKCLGSTLWEVGSILGAPGSRLGKRLKDGKGVIIAHIEEATNAGILHFQFRGWNFTNTEGAGIFNKSDPFFELQRWHKNSRTWDTVFRSVHIQNNVSPIWDESFVEVHSLCGGQMQQKFRILVLDHDAHGKHDAMGSVQLTIADMLEAVDSSVLKKDENDVPDQRGFVLTKAGKEVGKILVGMAEVSGAVQEEGSEPQDAVEPPPEDDILVVAVPDDAAVDTSSVSKPTFVQFVSGGCHLRVVVAVDSTASNGNPRDESSLHHFKKDGYNVYEDALFTLCSILSEYDSDQKYPVFGFGAKREGALSHCFPLSSQDEVEGVDGIINAYRSAFRSGIVMSSPRYFSELVKKASKDAKNHSSNSQSYSILVLLTNGDPADLEKTTESLKAHIDAPLSVIFVGVGADDFSGIMQIQSHVNQERKFVNFVPYESMKGDEEKLSKAALDDIPNQLVSYFVSKDIFPCPEEDCSEIAVEPYNESDDIAAPIDINEQGEAVVTGTVEVPGRRKKFKKLLDQGMKGVQEGRKMLRKSKMVGRIKRKYQRRFEQKVMKMF